MNQYKFSHYFKLPEFTALNNIVYAKYFKITIELSFIINDNSMVSMSP